MKPIRLRRGLSALAVAAAALGATVVATGTANAGQPDAIWFPLSNTGHGVGVYTEEADGPPSVSQQYEPPLFWRPGNPDQIEIDCWVVGGDVGNYGDVWYHTLSVYYATSNDERDVGGGWTFAPFVDGAAEYHNGVLPAC
jgi:hypothetical protein